MAIDIARGYLMGSNEQSLTGEIRMHAGGVECTPSNKRAASLNIECEMKEMGRLSLSTCLLEQRKEPYSLLLELARHRIKHFIAKCEDWQIWDHPGAADALAQWNEARLLFTAAMTTQDALQADQLSTRALIKGLQASERLAVAHSSIHLHRRYAQKPASKLVLGVRIDPHVTPGMAADSARVFDMIGLPLSWAKIETSPGQYDFSSVAPWVDWATKTGRTLIVGPVIDLQPSNLPSWISAKRGDFSVLRDGVWQFAQAVGRELAGRTGMWNVASGLNDNEWWPLDLEQMVELSRRAVVALRQARKDVPTLLEVVRPFGHDVAARSSAVTPRALIDALVTDGIHLDCVMVQLIMGVSTSGHLTRDLLELSALLDSYRPLRKAIFVALGAPSISPDAKAGFWRIPWSSKSQAAWATRMFNIAMSKSHVSMVMWESLMDDANSSSMQGVLDANRNPKPILDLLVSSRRSIRAPLGAWQPAVGKSVAASASAVISKDGTRDA